MTDDGMIEGWNPDAMSESELSALEKDFDLMRLYCQFKRNAMIQRKAGATRTAVRIEDECERIYERIPAAWKW